MTHWPTQKPTHDPVYMTHRFNNHEMHTTVNSAQYLMHSV